jgi:hypothetical protein
MATKQRSTARETSPQSLHSGAAGGRGRSITFGLNKTLSWRHAALPQFAHIRGRAEAVSIDFAQAAAMVSAHPVSLHCRL